MKNFDVIIIGSGISALTSAAILTKKGKSVLVLEQYSKPGGYMHSFKRFGELYDTGAHYVGALNPGQPFHTLLTYLDVLDDSIFVPLDQTAFDVFHFPEGAVTFPVGYENLIEELGASFPNEKSAIRTYFTMIRDVVKRFPTYNFSSKTDMMQPLEALDISLQSVVEKLTTNTKLQSVFYAYCSLHGVKPPDVSFGLHAIMVDSLILGPKGFAKGGDALTDKFIERIKANGGTILTKQKVTELVIDEKQHIKEVRTESGDIFTAEWVISSIHPKATFRLLSDNSMLTKAFNDRLSNMKESDGIFGAYAYCKNLKDMNPYRNYYYFQTSDPKKMFEFGEPEEIPPVVFTSMSRTETKGDSQVLSFHSGAPYKWFEPWKETAYGKRAEEYKKLKETIAEGIFSLVGQYQKDFRSHVEKYVTSTPLTNLYFNGSEEGSGYGIYHSIQNTGVRALSTRTKILNLLLTGQNCLFPGLLGASISALRTCGHVVGIKPILCELEDLRDKA